MFNGRLDLWQLGWTFFRSRSLYEQIFGVGFGSVRYYLPILQLQGHDPRTVQLAFSLHNDWLQILVECGWAGLLLAIFFLVKLFLRSSRRNQAFLLGFAAAMCGNPVLHFLPTLCLLLTVLWEELLA